MGAACELYSVPMPQWHLESVALQKRRLHSALKNQQHENKALLELEVPRVEAICAILQWHLVSAALQKRRLHCAHEHERHGTK